eukprot:gene2436-4726_t
MGNSQSTQTSVAVVPPAEVVTVPITPPLDKPVVSKSNWKCPFAPATSSTTNGESPQVCPMKKKAQVNTEPGSLEADATSSPTNDAKCHFAPKNIGISGLDASILCPVKWKKSTIPPQIQESKSETNNVSNESSSKCPVNASYRNPNQYNVYNQKIDPSNQMPINPNQQPSPNQAVKLSTERVLSQIPKAGTDESTWAYPSPQMFWNAIVRKNKVEGVKEQDIDTVVAIHNNMNENTWRQVLAWEELHPTTDVNKQPKLLRFLGRPHEISPKAYLKSLFGHPTPFDRHDWIVDRGGQEVRYVIDYYHDESGVDGDTKPKALTDVHSIQSIKVDVRPALDSIESIYDRILAMPYRYNIQRSTSFSPPPFFAPKRMIQAEELKITLLRQQWGDIQSKCHDIQLKLKNCSSEQECGSASVALQRCTASVICPDIVNNFDACIQEKSINNDKINASFNAMEKCLDLFRIESEQHLRKN